MTDKSDSDLSGNDNELSDNDNELNDNDNELSDNDNELSDNDNDLNDNDSDLSENDSDSEPENLGNSAWADAMCKVLNTNVPKAKNFILSKAKKDTDIKVKDKNEEIEMVDESGNVTSVKKTDPKPIEKTIKQKRKEMLEKRKQKVAWENMCRVKPEHRDKEKERELVRIATRGVLHLFNTVAKHQKNMKDLKDKKTEKKKSLGAVKGSFMDILKGHSTKQPDLEGDPVAKKVKQEETWSILKDNFMMGAEMKDWDKESDNE